MCGIAGIWGQATAGAERTVSTMLDAMVHRGPDGRRVTRFPSGALGAVRLALVDLSERGGQPMWSDDGGVALAFNGEMYNYREERDRLQDGGHRFRTTTDTEVVLALYLERGQEVVERLRGMYALCIVDRRGVSGERPPRLLLARDPFGMKPLYLWQGDGPGAPALAFSSELRAMTRSGLHPFTVDLDAASDFLTYGFVRQPRSMIRDVRMLEAGHLLVASPDGSVVTHRSWSLPAARPVKESFDEAALRVRHAIEDSVRLHVQAEAPLGAFVSGGVDSTIVAALMQKHAPRTRTYTLATPEDPGLDESREAADSARRLDCEHTTIEVSARQVREILPRFAADLDQPSVDGLNTWLVARGAATEVRGALSGLGGDEWFAGYPVTGRMARQKSPGKSLLRRVAPMVERLPFEGALGRRIRAMGGEDLVSTWLTAHAVYEPREARRLLGSQDGPRKPADEILASLGIPPASAEEQSAVGLSCVLDVHVYMRSQLLRDADAASMAHSLELRVPFVDVEVARLSRSCRDRFKLRPGGGHDRRYEASGAKRVLIAAFKDLLPDGLADRAKLGFGLPFDRWLATELAPVVDDACAPDVVHARGILDPALVSECVRASRDGSSGGGYPRVWALMILELWSRATLDPIPRSTTASEVALAGGAPWSLRERRERDPVIGGPGSAPPAAPSSR